MTIQELEQCIDLYGRDIYSFCMHLTMNKEMAEDLYQETFLEAVKKITVIRWEQNPKSYLLSVTIRLWKNQMRKSAIRKRIAPQVDFEIAKETYNEETKDIFENLVLEEEKKKLWQEIRKLRDSFKIPLLLYYMEEMSIAEISKLLSVPQGTVKSRLYHARKQLEKQLEGLM